jgi:hypothetical protein
MQLQHSTKETVDNLLRACLIPAADWVDDVQLLDFTKPSKRV